MRVSINLFAPRFVEDFDLQIAENLTLQSLAQCYGVEAHKVKDMVRKEGDYGDVAVTLRAQAKSRRDPFRDTTLTLDSIVEAALKMNSLTGDDSVQRKVNLIDELCR